MTVTNKRELRAALREMRNAHVEALPAATRALLFLRPPAPIAAMLPHDGTIGLYHARGSEAPTAGYARWLAENGYAIALPSFANRDAPMQFREWTDPFAGSDLEEGPYGIQPNADAPEAQPALLFVPLLGFTPDGHRLGQGGGHYDRWLGAHPESIAIGLAWDAQQLDSLPVEPHDRHLAAVITPTRFWQMEN